MAPEIMADSLELEKSPLFEGDDLRWAGRRLGPEESFAYCRALTRAHAKSFYFSSFALPRRKKDAAYAVYAFCRFADDLLDEDLLKTEQGKAEARSKLRELLQARYGRADLGLPFTEAFRRTVSEYGIPAKLFEELIEGVCMDSGPVRIRNFDELHLYCYRVASVVGLMMSRIFGLKDERGAEQAIEMGMAMQLTNILRDVKEDFEKGRIYLPMDELKRFELGEGDLAAGRADERWKQFMKFQVERARAYYRRGEAGIPLLEPDGSRMTVALMSAVYAGILDEIERAGYDVFRGRLHVSFARKLFLAAKAWFELKSAA
jgi:phytoene synthase